LPGRREGLAGLLILVLAYNVAASIYNNVLPLLIVSIGLGPLEVSIASFLVNSAYIALSPVSGRLGDRRGRKPLLSTGALLLLASTAIVVLRRGYMAVLLSALLAGSAGAFFSVNATMAAVEEGAERDSRPERPLASVGLASGAGWFTGLMLGSRAASYAGLMAAEIGGLILAASALILSLAVAEPPIIFERAVTAKPSMFFLGVVERVRLVYAYLTSFRRPLKTLATLRRRFDYYLAAMALAFTAVSLFFTQMPVYMRTVIGLSDSEVLRYMSIHSGTSTLTFALLYRGLIPTGDVERLLLLALAARSVAFTLPLLLAGLSPALMSLATFLTTGATWAMISVSMNSVALRIAEPARRGEKIGMLNSAVSLGILAGSLLSGLIAETLGFRAVFISASMLIALSLAIVVRVLRTVKKQWH
jgi:MFS family permease